MKYQRGLGLVVLSFALSACAGMMMDAKEVDGSSARLALKEGDRVTLAEPDVKAVAEESDAENAARVARLLKANLKRELAKNKIEVADGAGSADKQVSVRVTAYKTGCGFCRGFFPLFGLGNSAVDGEVELAVGGQHRKLVLTKTGQVSGMAAMGDQTESNTDYFATVAVARLTEENADEKQKAD